MADVFRCDSCHRILPVQDKVDKESFFINVGMPRPGSSYEDTFDARLQFFDGQVRKDVDICRECAVRLGIKVGKRLNEQLEVAKEKGHQLCSAPLLEESEVI